MIEGGSKMKLDRQQQAVVESKANNILVIAGAGSGKTRVLTERVKAILERGVQPHNVVVITFTNIAAEELKERLQTVNGIGDAFIGTIHSFANRIYKNSGVHYSLLTEEAEQMIYEEILNRPQYKALTVTRWLKYMDLVKLAEMGRIDENAPHEFLTPPESNVLYKCRPDVQKIMKRDGIITFDELIDHATAYYKSLGAAIEYLFVDELQDIGTREYKFIRALDADNYFFVGDDWQAIYGFKGGNVDIFTSLAKDKKFTNYYLENNYRNAESIVKIGERVIRQVPNRIKKRTNIISNNRGIVTTQTKAQTNKILRLLQTDKENYRDWFILTRSNRDAYKLADLLDDNDIDYCFVRKSDLTLDELKEAMKANQVKIMTVHASKGLENKKVILYGNFPIEQPHYLNNPEERKVMYVGVTRAEQELHIFN